MNIETLRTSSKTLSAIVDNCVSNVVIGNDQLSWEPRIGRGLQHWWARTLGGRSPSRVVRFVDIIGARSVAQAEFRRHAVDILSFRTHPFGSGTAWLRWKVRFTFATKNSAEDFLAAVHAGIAVCNPGRPRNLLVLLNPNSGRQQASLVYDTLIRPTLEAARIASRVVQTRGPGHAEQVVRTTIAEVASSQTQLDGILAVGGDGLFHEITNGLLSARDINSEQALVAARLRVAHVPCGSTDAVACSLNGTRSAFAAIARVTLGDETPLDVAKVQVGNIQRYACCIAAYGFMADVVEASERHRWLGPLRYDAAGFAKLVANTAYSVRVSWKPPHAAAEQDEACRANCHVCRGAGVAFASSSASFVELGLAASSESVGDGSGIDWGGEWEVLEGEMLSIMVIVQPCRSEKTPHGMARYAHLADGQLTLVLLRKSSPLHCLRFLATMSAVGLVKDQMPYVKVVDAVACRVEPLGSGPRSGWNLDGELLPGDVLYASAERGALKYFARGVKL
jgi:ceramide kinase